MSARDDLLELLTEYPHTIPSDAAGDLLADTTTEVRAEVLREAADAARTVGDRFYEDADQRAEGAWSVEEELRRMAEEKS